MRPDPARIDDVREGIFGVSEQKSMRQTVVALGESGFYGQRNAAPSTVSSDGTISRYRKCPGGVQPLRARRPSECESARSAVPAYYMYASATRPSGQ